MCSISCIYIILGGNHTDPSIQERKLPGHPHSQGTSHRRSLSGSRNRACRQHSGGEAGGEKTLGDLMDVFAAFPSTFMAEGREFHEQNERDWGGLFGIKPADER